MQRVTAVLLIVAVAVAGCGDGDADGDALSTTTSTESTTTSETTTSPPPASALESILVTAGPAGVQIVSPDGTAASVETNPSAVAFGIGSDLVVFQDADSSGQGFPPGAVGPVNVWSGGDVRTLATAPDATRTLLLDTAMIDGAPLVLVAERFGEVGPDDTFEELVQIDLRDDSRTTIVRRPAWESGHFGARFLPDGDVIGLISSEAHTSLARWTASSETPVWTADVGIDVSVELSLRDGYVTLIQAAFDPEQNLTPVLTVTARDEVTGEEVSSDSIHIDDSDGEIGTGLFCRDWASPTELLCGRADGEPIVVSVSDGSFRRVAGAGGSIPTIARPA